MLTSRNRATWLLLAIAPLFFSQTVQAQRAPVSDAAIVTSSNDYAPGSQADMWGSGFAAGEAVSLQVLHADGTPDSGYDHLPWTVLADSQGHFKTTWHVCEDDCIGSLLRVTATGLTSGRTAFAEFTDLLVYFDGSPLGNYTVSENPQEVGFLNGSTDIGNHVDDGVTTITLPFAVSLYGTSFNSASVSSNGNIQFTTSNNAYSNGALPSTILGATVFAYWDDLATAPSPLGIYTATYGTAPARTFVVEWRTRHLSFSPTAANFEVLFYEGQNYFDIVYGAFSYAAISNFTGTIGVQKNAGRFTQYAFNDLVPTAGTVLRFSVDTATDTDADGIPDYADNCILVQNPSQLDADGDGIGDDCDLCTDSDKDGFGNPGYPQNTCPEDSCPNISNSGSGQTADQDNDGVPNACDNCPYMPNADQTDSDNNGIGDACYCSLIPNNATDEEIFNVTVGSMSNGSTCSSTGGPGSVLARYSNFTNANLVTPPDLTIGSTYSADVTAGLCRTSTASFQDRARIFIDYNHNGSFGDAGEEVFNSGFQIFGNFPGITVSNTFTVPATAQIGSTGMRAVFDYSGSPAPLCGTYSYGETEDYVVNIVPANVAPVALCRDVTVVAADSCQAVASIDNGSYDPDGNAIAFSQSPAGPYAGNATSTTTPVTLTVTDTFGASNSCQANVIVENSPPVATITGPTISVYPIGSNVNFSATWSDANPGAHTAYWSFDGAPDSAFDAGTGSAGSANSTHTFIVPGVYQVALTVTDQCGAAGTTSTFNGSSAIVVIYDPTGSFVTGGGWINSPAGAYAPSPTLAGKATFGFVSKYKKGATVPTGETEFQFNLANLRFASTAYDWLVVSGSKAQYKGTGTIQGSSANYGFLLTATDGNPDKFRIKIWDKATSNIIYDNMPGASETTDPTTALGGGSIVIHK